MARSCLREREINGHDARATRYRVLNEFLRCLGLQDCCLRLQNLDLGFRLALHCLALLLRFLQPSLYPGVKLIDLLLQLSFQVGVSLGLLCLHLRDIGFHGSDVLVVNGLLYF